MKSITKSVSHVPRQETPGLRLDDGSRVAVMGGGPAGSFFSYFFLDMAARVGLEATVDIYEPRDFSVRGPMGCNKCGGIISESLVQTLAAEGINLPSTIVQRGIESYMLHMDVGDAQIGTPLQEKRIASVYRGSGPRKGTSTEWGSFDAFMLSLAAERGARVIHKSIDAVAWEDGRPVVTPRKEEPAAYDLLIVATGINSTALRLFQRSELKYTPPETTQTFICEYEMDRETMSATLGSSMHVFLLNIPRLEFAAIIPKGASATLCLLGDDLDKELREAFLNAAEVRRSMPGDWRPVHDDCRCAPQISTRGAPLPYGDRIAFIGDAGVTRLYKDGIGAAYRTAKAAASTAVFQGVSAAAFERSFAPVCRSLRRDNRLGRLVFMVTRMIQHRRFAREALLHVVRREQQPGTQRQHMSTVLWDMFTGSAPYAEVFKRTLHPVFLGRFGLALMKSLISMARRPTRQAPLATEEALGGSGE